MDSEFKRLLAGASWAENGDRTDPVSPVTRATGWPLSYSSTDAPSRTVINGILRELYGGAKEIVYGVSPYDAEVSYPVGAITQVNGRLYYANVANGPPGAVSPVTLNNATWTEMGGIGEAQTAPSAIPVGNIFIDGSQANRFIVYWQEPDNGNSPITTVDLQYSKNSAFPNTNETTTITDYQAGSVINIAARDSDLYYVRLRFNNIITEDGDATAVWSAEKKVNTSPVTPDAINSLRATGSIGGGLVDLDWAEPSARGLSISDYLIQWKSGTQAYSTTERNTTSTALSKQITGLANDTQYTFQVIARSNRSTNSAASNQATATPEKIPDVPDAPSILSFGISYGSFEVSVNTLPDDNGATITAFEWQIKRGGDNWSSAGAVTSQFSNSTGTNFSGLTSAQLYHVRCRAYNGVGDADDDHTSGDSGYGPFSQEIGVQTLQFTGPSTPTVSAFRDHNGNIYYGTAGSIASDGGAPVTAYGVQWRLSTSTGAWNAPGVHSATHGRITGLDRTKSYSIRMFARNSNGNSSGTSTPITVGPESTNPGGLTIDRSFNQGRAWSIYLRRAPNDGGSNITSYELDYSRVEGNNWGEWDSDSNNNRSPSSRSYPYWVVNDQTYDTRFRMRARNANGAGPWSNIVGIPRSV